MIGQMAIAIALPGFNNLGHSVTPIFLLMEHFLHRFTRFSEKMKKIYPSIPLFLALRLSMGRFQMPLA